VALILSIVAVATPVVEPYLTGVSVWCIMLAWGPGATFGVAAIVLGFFHFIHLKVKKFKKQREYQAAIDASVTLIN